MALRKNWRSLDEASAWAQAHNVRSVSEWRTLSKAPGFPDDLPPSPDNAYKNLGWVGWGAFLGTGTVAPQNKAFRSYDEASTWAKAKGIKTHKEWLTASKEPDFPPDIPKNLARGYGDAFKGLGDFLGTGAVAPQKRTYRAIEAAGDWAVEHGITTKEAWLARAKEDDFPTDLPADPRKVYGDRFEGWPAFLKSGRTSNHDRTFRAMSAAMRWAQDQGITTREQWRDHAQHPDFPEDLPKNPSITYGAAFPGWGMFLGTGRVANRDRSFRPYPDAMQWAQAEGITSAQQWFARSKEPSFPADLPVNPAAIYRNEFRENEGWNGFLGQTRLSGSSKIEKALKRGLDAVLDLSPTSRASVPLPDGLRPLSVDMVDVARRLVIEYDGWFWHHDARKETVDRRKTLRLTQANPAWHVIRVREAPLTLLDPVWDVTVPLPNGAFGPTIQRVMMHLKTLVTQGHLPDQGLLERLDTVLMQPIDDRRFQDLFQAGWATREEASAWARDKGVTTHRQWRAACNEPDFPDNLPKYPDEAYGAAFGNWGTFLGTGRVASQNKVYRTCQEASAWAQAHGIISAREWREHWKAEGMADEFPLHPDRTYKGEFKSWGEFLGTGRLANQDKPFRSYQETSQWAQLKGITTETQWRECYRSPDFPKDIPTAPDRTYRGEFTTWGDFFGTGNIASNKKTFRSYDDTQKWAQAKGIRSEPQWRKARKADDFPEDIPAHPKNVYPKQFTTWGEFFGTGTVAPSKRSFRTYAKTAEWARHENIRTAREWQERCLAPDFPSDIPTHPERKYREFPGWGTFLGTGNIANIKRTFRLCAEAAQWAQAEQIDSQDAWRERVKQAGFPTDIPKAPDQTYGSTFPGWGAFLNTVAFQARQAAGVQPPVPSRARLADRLGPPDKTGSDQPSPFPWRRPPGGR